MSKMQVLSVFLTERLTLAAQEIFKAVEDIFSDYNEELCRSRQEIDLLRRRLEQAGLQLDSETQSCSFETRDTQTFLEEQWTSEPDEKDTEVHMKLEVYTQQGENAVQMSMCNESTSLLSCVDTDHDQMASKDTDTQMLENSENDFPFICPPAEIKNEPGLKTETNACQAQHFMRHSSDDPGASDAPSSNKAKSIHIDPPAQKTQAFNLPLRNQEMLTQHMMELAQIRDRLASQERKKAAAKARCLKHKLKVYGSPDLLEAYRRKERERYQRRKSQGKVKSAKDLSPLDLRRQQKRWRENSANYRRRKSYQDVLDNIKKRR